MRLKTNLYFIPSVIPPAFGLDVSDSSAKYVQLAKTSRGLIIRAFGEIKLPQGLVIGGIIKDIDGLSAVLKKEFSKSGGKLSRHVIISVPDENVFLIKLALPLLAEDELFNAVRVEAERIVPISVEKAYLDYVELPRAKTDKKLEILAVAIQKDIADAYSEAAQKAGLKPIVIEPEVSAISRAAIKGGRSENSIIIIEIGANRTRSIVFARNQVVSTGSVDFSASAVNKKISEVLGVDDSEAHKSKWTKAVLSRQKKSRDAEIIIKKELDVLARGISDYIGSVGDRYKPQKIILSGGGMYIPDITKYLSASLDINVESVNPLVNITEVGKNVIPQSEASRYTAALGLALRGVQPDVM
jgi:type IV pilus assembly protein PilM